MHTYQNIENNPIYKGMPPFTENFHPCHKDFPLYCSLLLNIRNIPMGYILSGKKAQNGRWIEQDFRQYEFILEGNVSDGLGKMYLFIKGKENFFKHQPSFSLHLSHRGRWQKIPLTYETMSNMTEDELSIIWTDFD